MRLSGKESLKIIKANNNINDEIIVIHISNEVSNSLFIFAVIDEITNIPPTIIKVLANSIFNILKLFSQQSRLIKTH